MERELEQKIISCVKGESIVKPFSQVYNQVREKKKKNAVSKKLKEAEESIYASVIGQFLRDNPEFIREVK